MITGIITAAREAVIRMVVRGPSGHEVTVDAVIDTGFTGWLTLPPALIGTLGLPFAGDAQ
jgi:predicted aspartyl protease